MNLSNIKCALLVGFVFALPACSSSTDAAGSDESTPAAATSQELCSINAWNCVGQCVQFYSCCLKAGYPLSDCRADRDFCIEECHRHGHY